jgi:hypothetical protein
MSKMGYWIMTRILLRGLMRLIPAQLVVIIAALVVGRFLPADVLTTIITPQGTSGISPDSTFRLVDINRHLWLDIPIPISGDHISIYGSDGREVLIRTLSADNIDRLFLYNLTNGALKELSIPLFDTSTDITDSYSWVWANWSPDRQELWFCDEWSGEIYALDVATNLIRHVLSIGTSTSRDRYRSGRLWWSTDNSQIALLRDETIYVFGRDGSNLQSFDNPLTKHDLSYKVWWSNDNRQVFIAGFRGFPPVPETSFHILDFNYGYETPTMINLISYGIWIVQQQCGENDWLIYTAKNGERLQMWLMNLSTYEVTPLDYRPRPEGQELLHITWSTNCEWLGVNYYGANNFDLAVWINEQVVQSPLYVSNLLTGQTYFIGEQAGILRWIDDNTFIMIEGDEHGQRLIYEVMMDNIENRVLLGSYFQYQGWYYYWIPDQLRAVYFVNQFNRNGPYYGILDTQTGDTQFITESDELLTPFRYVIWRWE